MRQWIFKHKKICGVIAALIVLSLLFFSLTFPKFWMVVWILISGSYLLYYGTLCMELIISVLEDKYNEKIC